MTRLLLALAAYLEWRSLNPETESGFTFGVEP